MAQAEALVCVLYKNTGNCVYFMTQAQVDVYIVYYGTGNCVWLCT